MTNAKPCVHRRGSVNGGDGIAAEMMVIMMIIMRLSSSPIASPKGTDCT